MSQKAWMNAYTKGSKSLQAKLAKIHAKNPEFQEFIKQHGMGANLSVKQSGIQKKSVATVKPVTHAAPEKNVGDREAMIKAAAEKIRGRRLAAANRSAFGGELGGGFTMPMGGFRTYRESIDETVAANFRAIVPGLGKLQAKNRALDLDDELTKGIQKKTLTRAARMAKAKHIERFARIASGEKAFKTVQRTDEDIAYKDGSIRMYKGGWIALRDGKKLGTTMPVKQHAMDLLDATRKSIGQKTMDLLRRKRAEIASGLGRHSLATESAEKRDPKNFRSYDSAIEPETAKSKIKAALKRGKINKLASYISNPKYSVLDKNVIASLLKGTDK